MSAWRAVSMLHYLQAELLRRDREAEQNVAAEGADAEVQPMPQLVEQALKVTMAGIAAGMRNTG